MSIYSKEQKDKHLKMSYLDVNKSLKQDGDIKSINELI